MVRVGTYLGQKIVFENRNWRIIEAWYKLGSLKKISRETMCSLRYAPLAVWTERRGKINDFLQWENISTYSFMIICNWNWVKSMTFIEPTSLKIGEKEIFLWNT